MAQLYEVLEGADPRYIGDMWRVSVIWMGRTTAIDPGKAGCRYVTVSGSVARDDNSGAWLLLRKAAFGDKHVGLQIVDAPYGTLTGQFQITKLDPATDYVRLESTGEITRT